MEFKKVQLVDKFIYFIDKKRTSCENFKYQETLATIQDKKTCNSFSGLTRKGNIFYSITKY